MTPRNIAALAVAAMLFAPACRADAAADMAKVVEGFYGAYATFQPSDGIPDDRGRAKYEPFVSPALDRLLIDGRRAEDAFARANKDSPPLIEGDLFTSNFEGATSHRIGACKSAANAGSCTVTLTYDNGKDKPVVWNDTVLLVATPQGWRVNDIGYGANWAFANKGRLSDTLKQAIRNVTDQDPG